MPSRRRVLVIEVYAFHDKAFSMSVWYLLRSVEMVKDIEVLWDIVFVICMIYGSMRDIEAKDSKNMRL